MQKMKVGIGTFFLVCLLLLGGCSMRELEDRGFPLAIAIDKKDEKMVLSFDFPDLSGNKEGKNPTGKPVSFSIEAGAYYEAQKAYENNTNRVLDYNHLKAIIISQEFLADSERVQELLAWLEEEEVVARNTALFIAKEQAAEILTLTEETNGSVGKYLEQMLETQEDFKENKIMTIGDLMNQWHNRNEVLLIPVLTNNGNIPSITGYAAVAGFEYRGIISVEEAMQSFLCQGLLKEFLYRLKDGTVLEIQNLHAETRIFPKGEKVCVSTALSGNAQVKKSSLKNGGASNNVREKLNHELTNEMLKTAIGLGEKPGIDICNSYCMLGGYARDLYKKYKDDYIGYQKQLSYDFSVDMNLINE